MADVRNTILLIDDDPFFRTVLADAFTEAGFTVYTAKDGVEGVEVFLQQSPEAVISDMIMPRMGGVSTCMEIARLAGENQPVIVLLTSMIQGNPHEHESPQMGARVHIPKSTSPLDIVIIIEQLLTRDRYSRHEG